MLSAEKPNCFIFNPNGQSYSRSGDWSAEIENIHPFTYEWAVKIALSLLDQCDFPFLAIMRQYENARTETFFVKRNGEVQMTKATKTGDVWGHLKFIREEFSNEELMAVKRECHPDIRHRFWHWLAGLITGRKDYHNLRAVMEATPPGTYCIQKSLWERLTDAERCSILRNTKQCRRKFDIFLHY